MADHEHTWVIEDIYEDQYARVEYKKCAHCPARTSVTKRKGK